MPLFIYFVCIIAGAAAGGPQDEGNTDGSNAKLKLAIEAGNVICSFHPV